MEKQTKKNIKEAKDEKIKDQKIKEQILKSLEEAKTPEEKFQMVLSKYVEKERVSSRAKQDLKVQEKQMERIVREMENLQREYNKSVLMKNKLEEICREQQKLIKSVRNESMQKICEEEERRKESQSRFQSSLNNIKQSLDENKEENNKLRDNNIEMNKKLKYLTEQYQTRELKLEKLNEKVQLHRAKLSKFQMEAEMEKEILVREKEIALAKLLITQKMLKEVTYREKDLKEQLRVQSLLQKSNDIFATYKVEFEKMSKNSLKLEKESLEWKRKWERSNVTLIELATEKKERDEHAMRCNKQVEQLQKLLRALQTERTHLYTVIKENNVEVPAMPVLPPEPEPLQPLTSVADEDNMEVMSKNCAELKQTLASFPNQMKVLNPKGAEAEEQCKKLQAQEDSLKQKKSNKKSKSKKKTKKNNNGNNNCNKKCSPVISEKTVSLVEEELEKENDITNEIAMENQKTEEVTAPIETMPETLPQEDAQPAPSVEENVTPVAEPVAAAN